jgi:hypothetical protein
MTVKKKNPKPAGRHSLYKPEYCNFVVKLCKLGATDKDLANYFEVNEDTINEWKKRHPEFSESLKQGREVADAEIGESLYQRAKGYEHKEDQIFQFQGNPVIVPTVKHYPPDSTACIFWLKNRQPAKWRDIHNHTIDINQLQTDIKAILMKVCEIAGEFIPKGKQQAFLDKMDKCVTEYESTQI